MANLHYLQGRIMLNEWLYLAIFMGVSFALPAIAIIMAGVLNPKKPTQLKKTVYECGIETVGDVRIQFHVQYYIYALVFLIFDVETIFLFPWAVAYNQLTLFGILEAILFVAILLGGYFYAWRKRALEWI